MNTIIVGKPLGSKSNERLAAMERRGDVIKCHVLEAGRGNPELARAEAQTMFPEAIVVLPFLGEQVPS